MAKTLSIQAAIAKYTPSKTKQKIFEKRFKQVLRLNSDDYYKEELAKYNKLLNK